MALLVVQTVYQHGLHSLTAVQSVTVASLRCRAVCGSRGAAGAAEHGVSGASRAAAAAGGAARPRLVPGI